MMKSTMHPENVPKKSRLREYFHIRYIRKVCPWLKSLPEGERGVGREGRGVKGRGRRIGEMGIREGGQPRAKTFPIIMP